MKLYSVALALAACLSMAAAQGLDGLPDCAKSCATDSIPASCGLDVKCICTDTSFISGISCCILKSCPADKQQAAVQFANQICKTAGVTNMPQSPSCENENQSATGTSSASSTTTSDSSTSDPSTSDSSTSGSSTKTATNESNTSQTAATATTSTTSTTGSATSSATSAAHTSAGAAVSQHKEIGLLAAAGAAVAAFGMLA
ncbi:mucin-21 [Aspergillus pseudoviridinutans]|uniref:Mucin-21 n=1 Tax=Aspergillus pseudoviridinutans TaxID=1517512 RepID=A0A9P3BGL8_9EURO|nr:mucin-21 [Aspergillus pseudoviridinutans]GIJ89824.1 mucin-21 [Aspergillus pseudoviridinutans]